MNQQLESPGFSRGEYVNLPRGVSWVDIDRRDDMAVVILL
jgi:hypothetical protein